MRPRGNRPLQGRTLIIETSVLLIFSFLWNLPCFAQATQRTSRVKVIEGGTLIDGTGRGPVSNAVIIIDGNKISTISQAGSAQYPPGAQVISAAGKYVLPGLIEGHIHFHSWVVEPLLHYGVTSVYDFGNLVDWILAYKEGTEKGKIYGPRIFAVGPMLNGIPNEGPGSIEGSLHGFKDPELVRGEIRQLAARGVDGIKFYNTVSLEVLRAATDEAHKHGLRVGIHKVPSDAIELADAGVDALVHGSGIGLATIKDPAKRKRYAKETIPPMPEGNFIHYLWAGDPSAEPHYLMEEENFDEVIRHLIMKNVFINPTLVFAWNCAHGRWNDFEQDILEYARDPNLVYIPRENVERWLNHGSAACNQMTPQEKEWMKEGYRKYLSFLRRFVQAGGKIMNGSDPVHSGLPGVGLHQEMQLLIDAGLTPMEVILATTKNNAEYMKKDNLIGTLEPGKLADILIVDADPLQDIRNLRKVHLLMKDGEIMDTSLHAYYRNPFPRPENNIVISLEGGARNLPGLDTISPTMVTEGTKGVTISVKGRYFLRTSVVRVTGINVPTEFVSITELKARIPDKITETPGVYSISVLTPQRGVTDENLNKTLLFVTFK